MKTYTAVARRAGDRWEVEVIELPDIRFRVDELGDVGETVTAAIAAALGGDPDSFEVEVNSTVDEDVDAHVAQVADVTTAVASDRHPESAARTVMTAQQRLAHRLVGMGLSHRDSAYLMNLSHHRVRHLVATPAPPAPPAATGDDKAERTDRDKRESDDSL